ncbi:response regulator (plasmid) [Paracoccus liaowanqingii]|uniref:Response regulator n=1 Tax=Paracoccus liaowanqingii TaxID=2560053 RepID=A0A4Y5ST79_9RHOB|nr:response regulator [Paracoccus liaowanqingii]QDA36098.1 response regulator [Paracoccus liaowanqingii]
MASLRILVLENNFIQTNQLVGEIDASGDQVVGPFSNACKAIYHIDIVQAAILDVKLLDDTSFAVSDELSYRSIPFIFLTGCEKQNVPVRFNQFNVYQKPSLAAPLLHHLHYQYHQRHKNGPPGGLNIEDIVREMIKTARQMMPDHLSADRLVEGVLQRAIAQATSGTFTENSEEGLSRLLNEEYRCRAAQYLN